MFTGIVEELGEVTAVEPVSGATRLRVRGPRVTSGTAHGDSIAVSGVCLTVVDIDGDEFTVDVVEETLRRSKLSTITTGDLVNLERAAAVGDRLGGHIVQGHVDGTGTLRYRGDDGRTVFSLPGGLDRYLVEKGSIAVDGVSLTVVSVTKDEFTVALIPTTLKETTLGRAAPGELVNLEVDVIAKHIEKLTGPYLAHLRGVAEHNGPRVSRKEGA